MTTPHTHDASPHDWSWDRMIRHLRDEHGIQPPMVWTLADVHHAHLQAHRADPPASPEEKPTMPQGHLHVHGGGVIAWHDRVSRDTVIEHLAEYHGVGADQLADDPFGQHAALHTVESEPHPHEPDLTSWHAGTDRDELWAHLYNDHKIGPAADENGHDALKARHIELHPELGSAPEDEQRVNRRTVPPKPENYEKTLDAQKEAMDGLWAEITRLRDERDEVRQHLERIQRGNQRNVGSIDALEAQLIETNASQASKIQERDRQLRECHAEREKALEERDAAREECDQIREALMRKLSDTARLRARLAKTQNRMREAILSLRESGLLGAAQRLEKALSETVPEDPSLRMADAHEPEGEEDAAPTKIGDLRAARLRAVDDDAPRLNLSDAVSSLSLEIPAGTARLKLTFVPEEG